MHIKKSLGETTSLVVEVIIRFFMVLLIESMVVQLSHMPPDNHASCCILYMGYLAVLFSCLTLESMPAIFSCLISDDLYKQVN